MKRFVFCEETHSLSYICGVLGLALLLLWLGLFKMTPTEAGLIEPLIANHFALGSLYELLTVQGVSTLVGIAEITVAVGLLLGLRYALVGFFAGIASVMIFCTTLTFLLTTPGIWRVTDGVPVADFFLLKDVLLLTVSLMPIERNGPVGREFFRRVLQSA